MAYKKDKNKGGSRYARQIGLSTQNQNSARGIGAPNYEFYELEPGEVIDVILDDTHPDFADYGDIGKAKVRALYSEVGKDESVLTWAKPIDANVKAFPLKHEIVVIVEWFDELYYTHKLNIFNNPNQNALAGASLPDSRREYTAKRKANEYEEVSNSGAPNRSKVSQDALLGDNFRKGEIKPLNPMEGDIILDGRFGQSVRLGSNSETQLPNLKIKVGQPDDLPDGTYQPIDENFNDDPNSIWISSVEEEIPLNPSTIQSSVHLKFYDAQPDEFIGNQIFMNSDRIVINTKLNEFMVFAKKAINLVTEGVMTIDSAKDTIFNTNAKTIVNSPEIFLGSSDATEPLVLGDTLQSLLEEIVDLLLSHVHPTGTGPSGPPLPPELTQMTQWKNKISSALSKRNFSL